MKAFLLALLFMHTASAQLPHVKCRAKYKKIGCFDNGSKNTLLFNDRLLGIPNNKGHQIDWYNWEVYLHSLACRCNEEARLRGDNFMFLGYYGECYGAKHYPTVNVMNGACFGYSYVTCVDSTNTECVGTDRSQYVYQVGRDGNYTDWSEFSACSKTCGDGLKIKTRNCTNPVPSGLGRDCSSIGTNKITKTCNLGSCSVDGGFSSWTSFGKCTKTCGGGFKSRYRYCNSPAPVNGGKNCTGPYVETRSCVNELCKGPVGVSKAEAVVESFLLNFHNTSYPTQKPSGKFHQAIFAIQKAVANEFALGTSNKSLEIRLNDLRKFLKVATTGGSIDFARTTLGKSLFVFMKKKIEEGLPIDDLDRAAEGYLKSIKNDIGSKKFGELMLEKGDATLMFAVDTTGSMGDEIQAAKSIAQYIINMRRQFPVDFILSPFNDPGYGPVTYKDSQRKSEFVNAIQNIVVSGGGDCPELAFTGMIDALKAGPKLGSPMYVFTDASPKDDTVDKKRQLKDYASQYSSAITFFTHLGGCGDSKGIKSYEEIAAYTSGQIFPLLSHSELLKFKDYVENSLKNKNTVSQGLLSTNSTKKRSLVVKSMDVDSDSNVTSLIVSLSFKVNGLGNGITLQDFNGRAYTAQSSTPYTKVFSIANPIPGRFYLRYPPGQSISYSISVISDKPIDFQYYFMLQESVDSPVLTIPAPLTGRQNSFVLRVSNVNLLDRSSLHIDVVDVHGTALSSGIKLRMLGGGAFEAKLHPPAQKFKIALKGKTKNNYDFQRLSNLLSEAQKAVMVVISAGEESTASVSGGISKINVYVYNQGDAERFTFQGLANYGSISVDTTSKMIQKASNTTIQFNYQPSSMASYHVGKTDTITLKAIGTAGTELHLSTDLLLVP